MQEDGGLPDKEGLNLDLHTDEGGQDVQNTWTKRATCEKNPDCVGFANNYATGDWQAKKKDTGFDPATATYSQKFSGEEWEWQYIKERATAVAI